MSEKIRDGITGGQYETGQPFELFAPTRDSNLNIIRKGVTGKFNELIDDIGQIVDLETTNQNSIVAAINELNTETNNSVKINSTPQILVGSYTFGESTGQSETVVFKHDVEFSGNVLFTSSGDQGGILDISNTFISLGDADSLTPVGDGGLILERGNGLQDARVFWDEVTDEWKIKEGIANSYAILHKGLADTNALNYLLTGTLEAGFFEVKSTSPAIRFIDTNKGFDSKTWLLSPSGSNDDFVLSALSDDQINAFQAARFNRTSSSITGGQFFADNGIRLSYNSSQVESRVPLKVNSISNFSGGTGVTIENIKFVNESLLRNTDTLASFQNTGTTFNPTSKSILDFTINSLSGKAFSVDSSADRIDHSVNTYFNDGIFVENISQLNGNGLNFNNASIFNDSITLTSNTPTFYFKEADAGVDSKYWYNLVAGGGMSLGIANDALDNLKPGFRISRTVNNITRHECFVNDLAQFVVDNGTTTLGNNALNSVYNLNLRNSGNNNIKINFIQNSSIKGDILYDDGSNTFRFRRYRDADGAFAGSIDLAEGQVNFTGLNAEFSGSINVNTINDRTGGVLTINTHSQINGDLSVTDSIIKFGTRSSNDHITFDETTNEFKFIADNAIGNSKITTGSLITSNTSAILNEKTAVIKKESNGDFHIFNTSDDTLTTSDIYLVDTTGINATRHIFYTNNNPLLDFNETRLIYNGDQIQINGETAGDPRINLFQNNSLRGAFTYEDSFDRLGIYKYSTGAGFETGLRFFDNRIEVIANSLNINTISERTSASGVSIDGVLLKDSKVAATDGFFTRNANVDNILSVNTINERTSASGVTIENNLLKDGTLNTTTLYATNIFEQVADQGVKIDKLTVKDSVISSLASVNIIIDSNNNDITSGFGIYNHDINNKLFIVTDEGVVSNFRENGGECLVVTAISTNPDVANFLSFNVAEDVNSNPTRQGYIGLGSSSNSDMYIHVDGVNSDIRLNCSANVFINNNLAWHAGNDGSGSGLDADLLDGQHGSFYQNASNLNTGLIPDAQLQTTGSFTPVITNITAGTTIPIEEIGRAEYIKIGNICIINCLLKLGFTPSNDECRMSIPFTANNVQLVGHCWFGGDKTTFPNVVDIDDVFTTDGVGFAGYNTGNGVVRNAFFYFKDFNYNSFGSITFDNGWVYVTFQYRTT